MNILTIYENNNIYFDNWIIYYLKVINIEYIYIIITYDINKENIDLLKKYEKQNKKIKLIHLNYDFYNKIEFEKSNYFVKEIYNIFNYNIELYILNYFIKNFHQEIKLLLFIKNEDFIINLNKELLTNEDNIHIYQLPQLNINQENNNINNKNIEINEENIKKITNHIKFINENIIKNIYNLHLLNEDNIYLNELYTFYNENKK